MDTLHKWNIKIVNFQEENEELGRIMGRIKTFIMTQVDIYPRLSLSLSIFIIFLIIYNRPWIIILVSLSLLTGFHSIEFLQTKLPLVITYIQAQRTQKLRTRSENSQDYEEGKVQMSDPLLHNENNTKNRNYILTNWKSESIKESQLQKERELLAGKSPNSRVAGCSRLKINAQLDKSIAHFCSLIFDAYISPDWAPFETRKQLKLTFVKLLTNFAERVLETFAVFNDNESDTPKCYGNGVSFCRDKVIPLAFLHIRNGRKRKGQRLSPIKMERALWKIRRLCRTLLETQLSQDDQQCLLWMELCVSVLADGVIWNLILLGRTEIPILIQEVLTKKLYKDSNYTNISPSSSTSQCKEKVDLGSEEEENKKDIDEIDCLKPKIDIRVQAIQNEHLNAYKDNLTSSEKTVEKKIHFLLDNFLDPSHDVEQEAMIVSRWKPLLSDILNERELLYALIQHLRNLKSLEYLQAVLDDSPDGSEYCRKILELEYLPGFCRSKLFLESMGLTRYDEVGLEAGVDTNTLKKPLGHTRSASYGSERETSGIRLWKIDQHVVDGIAIYDEDKISQSIPFQEIGTVETTDSIFKRRHVLEVFITKFLNSVNSFGKHVDPSAEPVSARRRGTDLKDYEDFSHPDIMSTVEIEPGDIFAETINLVISPMSKTKWIGWMTYGWMKVLHPFLKPKFDDYLDSQIANLLSTDNFIQFVDVISETFLKSTLTSAPQPQSSQDQNQTKCPRSAEPETNPNLTPPPRANLRSLGFTRILESVFDLKIIISSLDKNNDEFILFCVDLLDILVAELIQSNTKTTNSIKSTYSTGYSDNEVKFYTE